MAPRRVLVSRVLLSAALLGSACAGPTGRPPQPDSAPETVQRELGYRNVLQVGEEYARQQGFQVADAGEAVQVRPNIWRVRFALAERGSGKLLELEFDEVARQVIRAQEIEVVPSAPLPGRSPQ